MAKMLIEQLSEPFDAAKYTDDYRLALQQLVQNKIAGKSPDIVNAPASDRTNVIDLMAALQASLEATKPATSTGRGKRRAAKKETIS